MKLARAIAARQHAGTISEQTAVSAPVDNRHQVCQEANADCMLRDNVIAQKDVQRYARRGCRGPHACTSTRLRYGCLAYREDEWSCGVCYEEVCHPYTLPCGTHMRVLLECITKFIEESSVVCVLPFLLFRSHYLRELP